MKTIENLIRKFNRQGHGYEARIDRWSSYDGHYVINVREPACGLWAQYTFTTAREFREWMDGVVLD